ncbi:hypothetical protein [Oharaeibacter diazotrophicus]|uniref:Lipoprotein n=1 Tax=Oharaeibacter diazotrophicus TaxID=1920512 RepID=A0A4R6RCR8_9HYPH|nr:hypothetical protein [Oharaeibacter diazotrophicus]TDP84001.1 hypothetical protein EDD54_2604 [Oharaeibacter diazotrophicus]BBE73040.1 hypothetical protein OHA_1_02646 [Pleomorphomonas sp. SM30]GLS74828.1 hypothetical protein GCM10007904_01630 [Oharaeibacter diazotrophicus]
MVNARIFATGIALLTILLSACAREKVSSSEPKTADVDFVTLARESPTARKLLMEDCIRYTKDEGFDQDESFIELVGVPRERTAVVACGRFVGAIASGRLTMDDIQAARRKEFRMDTFDVIRGR